MGKKGKIALIVGCLLIVIILVAGFVVGNIFVDLALNPNSDKTTVLQAEHNSLGGDANGQSRQERQQANNEWLEEVGYSEIQNESRDNLLLNAYVIENEDPEANWVVICHGYNGYALQMLTSARTFYDKGYNILLPDARASGKSEGTYIGMGWPERLDIVDWTHVINEQYDPVNIVLYGVSMGGATVMMTSGEELPNNVRAIVEDCGYTSAHDEFSYQLNGIFGLPSFPIMNFSSAVAKVKAGYFLGEASAVKQVAKSETPILFIHGDEDTFVPSSMVYTVYDAAASEKELLIIEGAGHGGASGEDPELYWGTVDDFLEHYLQ